MIKLFNLSDPSAVRCGNVDTFLSFFQTIMQESDDRVAKIKTEKLQPRRRDRKYQNLDDRIIMALDEYEVI